MKEKEVKKIKGDIFDFEKKFQRKKPRKICRLSI